MKKSRAVYLGVALAGLALAEPSRGGEGRVVTLEEAVARGRERSLGVASARLEFGVAGESVRMVRAQVYPSLDVNARYTRMDEVESVSFPGGESFGGGREAWWGSVGVEQLLYSGGSVRAALRIATNFMAAARYEVEMAEAGLIREITRSFYHLLYLEEEVAVARESYGQLEALVRESEAKRASGVLSEFEGLSAQVALANERPRVAAAENRRAVARLAFRDLIRLERDDFELQGRLESAGEAGALGDLLERSLDQRPEVLAARSAILIAKDDEAITRGGSLPEIRAFASYEGNDPSQRNVFSEGWEWGWMAGVRVSWSLWDGGYRRAEGRAKALHTAQARLGLEEVELGVRLEVESAWRGYEDARLVAEGTGDAVALAERAMEIARVRFEQGLSTYLEFTDSNLALSQARLNHAQALVLVQQALADLAFATGDTAAWLRQESE
ncbi:MAG TPA: TolC family protein [Kiritimatiellia bacterium]|nr:TolC family protein [Kiritimatiellia bacterium]